jgi:streptogramin lyase
MKKNITLFLLIFLCVSCNQSSKDNIAYRITEQDLIPEGITYSLTTESFYVSSLHKNKIVRIDAKTGEFEDFISSDLIDQRILGMIVDEDRKHLWACANKAANSTVAKFNLKTGDLIKSYVYTDSVANMYNDLAQDKEGNIYFTNSNKQTIYKIDQQADSVAVFFDSEQILHPNGITISPDNKYLYIASNDNGIRILDIENRKITDEPDSTIQSTGLDGLKYYKNTIIGLQNEVKSRSEVKIAQYFLDESGTKIIDKKIIDQNNPHFDIPTTFVIVDNYLYCLANSQTANIDFTTNEIRSYEALDDVLILKYKL